jgi:hypothetical protein
VVDLSKWGLRLGLPTPGLERETRHAFPHLLVVTILPAKFHLKIIDSQLCETVLYIAGMILSRIHVQSADS